MRLSDFIRAHSEEIVEEWVSFARDLVDGPTDQAELRDHAPEILEAIAVDLETRQTRAEQAEKAMGRGEEHAMRDIGTTHATLRLESGFQLTAVIAEYRALRASVLRLAAKEGQPDYADVMRFNESIDETLAESVKSFAATMTRHQEEFVAILGHDLRNPLGAVTMSAHALRHLGDQEQQIADRILRSTGRMDRLINDLLDLTRTRLGGQLALARSPADLAEICAQMVAELRAFHPNRLIELAPSAPVLGSWDGERLSQVVSNLVANALQYSDVHQPVHVRVADSGDVVMFSVHNEGVPIPPNALASIFEPLVRHSSQGPVTSLGLGLYIVREIVRAHSGVIEVTSTKESGTTFVVTLPRAEHSQSWPVPAAHLKE